MTSSTLKVDISRVHIGLTPFPSIYTSTIMITISIEHLPRLQSSELPITPLFVSNLSSFNTNTEVEHLLETLDGRVHMATTSTNMVLHDVIPQAL